MGKPDRRQPRGRRALSLIGRSAAYGATAGTARGELVAGNEHVGKVSMSAHLPTLESMIHRAEEHVAMGEKHVERQRALIAYYERRGWDVKPALELLST